MTRIAVLALTGCIEIKTTSSTHTMPTTPTTPSTTTPTSTGAVEPPGPLGELNGDQLAEIAAAIDDLLGAGGTFTIGIHIVDADNGQVVYSRDPDVPRVPASNTKLFTTLAALETLGVDHRMGVTAFGTPVGVTGHVDTLTVVSEHAYDWSTWFYDQPEVPAERLAAQLWDVGVRSVDTVVASGEFLVEGDPGGVLDVDLHRGLAADALAVALADAGIAVGSTATSDAFEPPADELLLTERPSVPLSVATFPTNVYSHNEQADLLCRHLGWALRGLSTYEAGTAAVEDVLVSAGIDITGLVLNDGSGKSRDNQVTPRQVVELLQHGLAMPYGPDWERTFSIPGVLGTLEGRLDGPDTFGRFRGKTGTHNTTVALSGVLHHVHDGHRYLVSILINDLVDDDPSREVARALADDIVEVVAADHRFEARPATPTLRSVFQHTVSWDPVVGAETYVVWTSSDGTTWNVDDARDVADAIEVVVDWAPSDLVFVRVTAVAGTVTSDPSGVLGSRTGDGDTLLLVDGVERNAIEPENPTIGGHDYLVPTAVALGERPFDSVIHELLDEGAVPPYAGTVWVLGEHGATEPTPDGPTFVSGATLGEAWVADVLGSTLVDDAVGTHSLIGDAGTPWEGVGELGAWSPGREDVQFPDALDGSGLSWLDGDGGSAVYTADALVVLGVPLEVFDDAASRAAVMDGALAHLGL